MFRGKCSKNHSNYCIRNTCTYFCIESVTFNSITSCTINQSVVENLVTCGGVRALRAPCRHTPPRAALLSRLFLRRRNDWRR